MKGWQRLRLCVCVFTDHVCIIISIINEWQNPTAAAAAKRQCNYDYDYDYCCLYDSRRGRGLLPLLMAIKLPPRVYQFISQRNSRVFGLTIWRVVATLSTTTPPGPKEVKINEALLCDFCVFVCVCVRGARRESSHCVYLWMCVRLGGERAHAYVCVCVCVQ